MAEDFEYTFNISAGTGGTVSPSGTRVIQQGESLVVTAYPASGYDFDGFLMLGVKRYDNPITLTGAGTYPGPFNLIATFKQTTVAGVWIYNNGWKRAIPWIYNNGWKRATAFIYDGGWKQGG